MRKWLLIVMSLYVSNVLADACLLESKQGEYPNKSCMQNAGTPVSIFKDFCNGAGDESNTITMLPDCPGESIALCEIKLNGLDGKFVQHIYTSTLVQAYKLSCENNMVGKGVWKFN